jgi:hypothetical protein
MMTTDMHKSPPEILEDLTEKNYTTFVLEVFEVYVFALALLGNRYLLMFRFGFISKRIYFVGHVYNR